MTLEIDDSLTEEENNLLFSDELGLRIFILNNSTNTQVLGVLMEESDDSFLVGLPSKLVENEILPLVPIKYGRILKSSIMMVVYPYGILYEKYIAYLKTKGASVFPELIDAINFEEMTDCIVEEKPVQPNQQEIIEKVAEALEQGGVILTVSKTKH